MEGLPDVDGEGRRAWTLVLLRGSLHTECYRNNLQAAAFATLQERASSVEVKMLNVLSNFRCIVEVELL